MIITNSLGSNYTATDRGLALRSLFQPWKWKSNTDSSILIDQLWKVPYLPMSNGGLLRVGLFLKGRQAIREALIQAGVKRGDEVIVQAFTCVAVIRPIIDLRAVPIYVDVNKLNPTLRLIKKAFSAKTKAVILQHTLGYANPENDAIVSWCRTKKVVVIQDLAHALGALGLSVNNCSVVLSFSQDKAVDGVSGGALIAPIVVGAKIKNQKSPPRTGQAKIKNSNIFRYLFYPIVTYLIRVTYNLGIGRIIHWLAKNFGLLPSPITIEGSDPSLPGALMVMAEGQLKQIEEINNHRRKIALVYDKFLSKSIKIVSRKEILAGVNLRYPIRINNREQLENELKKHGFYLLDHWYDAPVAPDWVNYSKVKYIPGSCPVAEKLSQQIFNLPTHVNINQNQAIKLSRLIGSFI